MIREMQVKTKMQYHLTSITMAIIKKNTNNKCWQGCGEKGTPLHYRWECTLVQPLWKTVWRFLKKLKIALPFDSAIPLRGIKPNEPKNTTSKTYMRVFCLRSPLGVLQFPVLHLDL